MGNNPSQEFCPELASAVYADSSETLFSIPYVFVLIVLIFTPILCLIPCYADYILSTSVPQSLNRGVAKLRSITLGILSLLDIGFAQEKKCILSLDVQGNLDIISKSKYKKEEQERMSNEAIKGDLVPSKRYFDLSKELRALGGYISLILTFLILGAFFFMYTTHESLLSESIVVHPIGRPPVIGKSYLSFTISNLPCKTENIGVQVARGVNPTEFLPEKADVEREGDQCKVSFYSTFGGEVVPSDYKMYIRVVRWNAFIPSESAIPPVEVKIQAFAHQVEEGVFVEPFGESAFVFMDSCRRAYFDPTKHIVYLRGSLTVRSRCQKLLGSALTCFDDNLSLSKFHVTSSLEGVDPLLQIEMPLGDLKLNSFISKKLDVELFVTLVVCILTFLVLQPILKRVIVSLVLTSLERVIKGRSFGVFKSLSICLSSCIVTAILSFIFFIFVTDVYLEFKKLTPGFVFTDSMWVFGRDAEIVLVDIVLFILLLVFNIFVDAFFILVSIVLMLKNDSLLLLEEKISKQIGPLLNHSEYGVYIDEN